jgi:hypothetical protein
MGIDLDESSEVDKLKAENEQLKNQLAEASKKEESEATTK